MITAFLIAAASGALSSGEPAYSAISPRYADCVELVIADLEIGRIAAQQWVSEGGGAPARHCLANANLMAGLPKLAALQLEEIAQRPDAGDDYMRARLLNQAARSWLLAGQTDLAEAALDQARALVPDSGELQLTAAKIYGVQEKWQDAIDAVNAAEEAEFVSAETFVLRGRARYTFGAFERAAYDVVAALNLDPTNLDALVLRGDLQQSGIVIDVDYSAGDQ